MRIGALVASIVLLLAALGGTTYEWHDKYQANEASLKIIRIQDQEKAALALRAETLEDAFKKEVAEKETLRKKIQENEAQAVLLTARLGNLSNEIQKLSQGNLNIEKKLEKKNSEFIEVSRQLKDLRELNNTLFKKIKEQEQYIISEDSQRIQAESGFLALFQNYVVKAATKSTDHGYKISPIYLVPSDVEPNLIRRAEVDRAMAVVQAWYSDRIERTFEWTPTIVIQSPFPASYYRDPEKKGGILPAWNTVGKQLNTLLPAGLPSLGSDNRIYVVFLETGEFIDHAGWGEQYLNDGGLALLGEAVLSWVSASPDLLIDSAFGHSMIAHELGHTFGLQHLLKAEIKTEDRQVLARSPYLK